MACVRIIFILLTFSKLAFSAINEKEEASPFLTDAPNVDCLVQRLNFEIETKKPFIGRLFVKGHSNSPECSVDFSGSSENANDTRKAKIAIDYHKCGMERIRSLSPKGITYANVITVQFHRLFITQGDKSFRVRCFYAEQEKAVTSDFDVSMVPTKSIERDMELPSCGYTIRADTPNGPVVRSTIVGDLVYHRWECSKNMQIYGMLVHSCIIENESGRQTLMIDPLGCATEVDIVPGLTYNDELNLAYTNTRVFKYPDDSVIRFRCQIRICTKLDNGCQGLTPPSCETSRKIRRSLSDFTTSVNENTTSRDLDDERRPLILVKDRTHEDEQYPRTNLDVITREIFVLDEDEPDQETRRKSITWSAIDQEEENALAKDHLITDYRIKMPQHKSHHQRQASYASFFNGIPSISPSPAPTSSSDHRRSTLRRGTDTTGILEADNLTFTSDVHSNHWELCANRIILLSILSAFVLFFLGSISFVVYILMERSKLGFDDPNTTDTRNEDTLSNVISTTIESSTDSVMPTILPYNQLILNMDDEKD